MEFPQKLKIVLPYDESTPNLGIHPKEIKIEAKTNDILTIWVT